MGHPQHPVNLLQSGQPLFHRLQTMFKQRYHAQFARLLFNLLR